MSFAQNCSSPAPLRYGGDVGRMVHEVVLKICSLFLLLLLLGLPKYALFEGKAIVSRSGRGGALFSFLLPSPFSPHLEVSHYSPCSHVLIWDRGDIFLGKDCGMVVAGRGVKLTQGGNFTIKNTKKDLFGLFFQANSSADNADALLTDLETRRAVQEGKIILQGSVAAGAFRE